MTGADNLASRVRAAAGAVVWHARELREGLAVLGLGQPPPPGASVLGAAAGGPAAALAERVEAAGEILGALPLSTRLRLLRLGCACAAHVALLTDEDIQALALGPDDAELVKSAGHRAINALVKAGTDALPYLPVMSIVRTALVQRLADLPYVATSDELVSTIEPMPHCTMTVEGDRQTRPGKVRDIENVVEPRFDGFAVLGSDVWGACERSAAAQGGCEEVEVAPLAALLGEEGGQQMVFGHAGGSEDVMQPESGGTGVSGLQAVGTFENVTATRAGVDEAEVYNNVDSQVALGVVDDLKSTVTALEDFNPTPFLSGLSASVYNNPQAHELPEGDWGAGPTVQTPPQSQVVALDEVRAQENAVDSKAPREIPEEEIAVEFEALDVVGSARTTPAPPTLAQVNVAEFEEIGILGVGSFGVVTLERHLRTGARYALKRVSKGLILRKGMESKMLNEKNILAEASECAFICRLHGTMNSGANLVFVLEPCLGGELYHVYFQHNLFGSEPHARFYTACAFLGLEFLHARDIVYRDLKPENLLLSKSGYAKLTDMGFSKRLLGNLTYTVCGSVAYFAPEVIAKDGHGLPADWWALGVFLYELFVGITPFDSEDDWTTYRKIIRGIGEVEFSKTTFTSSAIDLVQRLCIRDPEDRLWLDRSCVGLGGRVGLANHEWFTGCGFNWQALEMQGIPPPHVPDVRDDDDLANFPTPDSSMFPEQHTYRDPENGWDREF